MVTQACKVLWTMGAMRHQTNSDGLKLSFIFW